MPSEYRVWADIDLDAMGGNLRRLKEGVPNARAMAVVKADAYGHGAVAVAKFLEAGDLVDAFGVAVVEEGVELRDHGIEKPILILGYTPQECFGDVVRYDLIQAVWQYRAAALLQEEAAKQGKVVRIHVKVDTGMGRLGLSDDESGADEVVRMCRLENCMVEGCFSHFAKADEEDLSFTRQQWKRFREFIHILGEKGVEIPIKHIGNSAAAIQLPEAGMDMVRYGIAMYGMYPSDQVDGGRIPLEPAMAIRARIGYIKDVDAGTPIGYGGTFVTSRRTRVATIPAGYADGYPWALSGKGRILWKGESAPILGRVCMDYFMVDVTHLKDAKEGDVVTLLGDGITAEEWGAMANSFCYEVVCGVSKRVPRIYRHS